MQELNYQVASDRAKIRAILAHLSWLLDLQLHKPAASTVKEYFEAKKPKGQKNGWDIDHIAPGSKKAKDAKLQVMGENDACRRGDIVVFDFSHIGLVTADSERGEIESVDGNTNGKGERDSESGDGVWRKYRPRSDAKAFIRLV